MDQNGTICTDIILHSRYGCVLYFWRNMRAGCLLEQSWGNTGLKVKVLILFSEATALERQASLTTLFILLSHLFPFLCMFWLLGFFFSCEVLSSTLSIPTLVFIQLTKISFSKVAELEGFSEVSWFSEVFFGLFFLVWQL